MFNRLFNLLPMGAIAFCIIFFNSTKSNAQSADNYSEDLGQITNVNQLRDVAPTDWAYEARRSLVDRYGCISGFPNQTYRGN